MKPYFLINLLSSTILSNQIYIINQRFFLNSILKPIDLYFYTSRIPKKNNKNIGENMAIDLRNTPIFRLFLSYFFPSFIGMLVLSSYVIVDGIFVGKGVGEYGLGAIGIVNPLFSFFMAIELLFGIGGAVLVGMALGRGKLHKARIIFSSVVYFSGILGALLGILVFILKENMALWLGADEILLSFVLPYLSVIVLGCPIILLQSILCTFARNDKAPNLVMISFISGSIINIILNYIFIFIFKWGMFGAALSTILGHLLGLIIVLKHFICKNGDLYFVAFFSIKAVIKSAKGGLASSMPEIAFGIVVILMNILLMQVSGKDGVAIFSILMYIAMFCFSSILAVSHGLQPIVSYNFGSGNLHRVYQAFKISVLFATAMGVLLYTILFFGMPLIAKIFLKADTQIMDSLVIAARIYFLGYLFLGANVIISSFLQAIGRNVSALITSLSHNLGFMMIFLPIGAKLFGINGIWISYPMSLFCACLVSIFIIKKELKSFKGKQS
ncbi:hypothetical protein CCY99_02845 [Helicobacter sp. 16-1353]|uniref:MATE family efflux transporter n=1 Tax=Helicobacter sp. 16-1353 TaxID=2004996 RepID=UPI000DCBDD58|nr:MATE family efflux transporter [Helicobacter sp. 16-1353]RAX54714.1 hypothetical protein CCY99_02845 [Helicobacter sp. 16-1353]